MEHPNQPYLPLRPDITLRLEALCELVALCFAYQALFPGHWLLFAALFLVPDLSLLGYAFSTGPAAAALYNLFHSAVLPIVLGLAAWHAHASLAAQVALIWLAHISFDRLVGYGPKYPGLFQLTHIQNAQHPPTTNLSF